MICTSNEFAVTRVLGGSTAGVQGPFASVWHLPGLGDAGYQSASAQRQSVGSVCVGGWVRERETKKRIRAFESIQKLASNILQGKYMKERACVSARMYVCTSVIVLFLDMF